MEIIDNHRSCIFRKPTWSACGFCFIALLLCSCSNTTINKEGKVEELPEFQVSTIQFADSIAGEDGASYFKAEIDVPVGGPDTLVQNIQNWINEELGGSYTGALNCDSNMMRNYARDFFENELDDAFPGSGTEYDINRVAENDLYVSYMIEGYIYTGGAHGMPVTSGVTFAKKTGKKFGWDMFNDGSVLRDQIKNALIQQFFEGNREAFDNATEIMVKDPDQFPLPETDPWLVDDSVQFVYQAYEIAPYSVGQPMCRLAVKDVLYAFSEQAKYALLYRVEEEER